MGVPLLEMEGTWQEIAAKVPDFADRKLHVIVEIANATPQPPKDMRPIAEILAELSAKTDPNEVAKLPCDLTSQLDHYIYGTPKR